MMRMGKFEKWWERGGEKDLGIYVQREREGRMLAYGIHMPHPRVKITFNIARKLLVRF
jgi:hypothetical protein